MRIPKNRPPTTPGDIIKHQFLEPLGMTPVELAEKLDVPESVVSDLLADRHDVDEDMANRLARTFGTTAAFWMNLAKAGRLYRAGVRGVVSE